MTKVVFFGSPELAVPFLDALDMASDFEIVAVVTQPDKPVGRKQKLEPTPVKVRARELGLPILELKNLKSERANSKLKTLNPELFVVVAYGKIIPKEILDIAPTINAHPSMLPKYRGPSPIQSAILAGDSATGISIMILDTEMDHGPVLAQKPITIESTDTARTLEQKIIKVGAPLLVNVAREFIKGNIKPIPQDDRAATYCKILTRDDGRIDWNKAAKTIDQKIRAFDPWPGTYTFVRSDSRPVLRLVLRSSAEPSEGGSLGEGGKGVKGAGNDTRKGVSKLRIKILKARTSNINIKLPIGHLMNHKDRLLVATGSSALEILELQPAGKKPMNAQEFLNGYPKITRFE